jgi:hypothetical protein
MAQAAPAARPRRAKPPRLSNRINMFFEDETADRIHEIARYKGVADPVAVRFLVKKGLDWWDQLSRIEKEMS